MADNDITPPSGGFSEGLNSIGAAFDKLRAVPASTQVEVKPPVEKLSETPVKEEKPKAETPPEDKPEKPEVTKEVKVPDLTEAKKALKHADFKAAQEAAYKRGREELEREYKEKYISKDEHDKMLKELDTYRKELRTVALDRDPEFQRQFEMKRKGAIMMAKGAAGEFAGQVEDLLKLPASSARDNALEEIMGNLTPVKQARITGALAVLEQAEAERQDALANADRIFSQRQAEDQTRRQQFEQMTAAERRKAEETFNAELERAMDPESGIEFLREKDGDTEHNEQVNYVKTLAKHIFNGAKGMDEIARASVQAALYKPLLISHAALHEQVKALTSELDKLRGKKPSAGASNGGSVGIETTAKGLDGMMADLRKKGLVR